MAGFNFATPVAEHDSMTMTLVGLGQRKVLNLNVGFRGASSVTAAPASSLNRRQLLISPNCTDRPLDQHSGGSTPPNVASNRGRRCGGRTGIYASSGAKWASRCKCLSGALPAKGSTAWVSGNLAVGFQPAGASHGSPKQKVKIERPV
jgi:hypothetical protein